MKTLLLLVLSMAATARDATAQEDAQCVRERAAMVETIKDYARSHANVVGQQGFSERVLDSRRRPRALRALHAFTGPVVAGLEGSPRWLEPCGNARLHPRQLPRMRSADNGCSHQAEVRNSVQ